MDIQKIIGELLEKFNVDASLLEKFKKDPMGTVKELIAGLGLNLDLSQLNAVVDGLKTKLNLEGLVNEAQKSGGILGFFKNLFGGK
jgi:hypothetical protein